MKKVIFVNNTAAINGGALTVLKQFLEEVKERKELSYLYNEDDLNYGYIICKCKLIDCIEMTEEFIEKEKQKNPNNFIAGRYEVGRYAWVLDEIEPIKPIRVKGQLGIWNYKGSE